MQQTRQSSCQDPSATRITYRSAIPNPHPSHTWFLYSILNVSFENNQRNQKKKTDLDTAQFEFNGRRSGRNCGWTYGGSVWGRSSGWNGSTGCNVGDSRGCWRASGASCLRTAARWWRMMRLERSGTVRIAIGAAAVTVSGSITSVATVPTTILQTFCIDLIDFFSF